MANVTIGGLDNTADQLNSSDLSLVWQENTTKKFSMDTLLSFLSENDFVTTSSLSSYASTQDITDINEVIAKMISWIENTLNPQTSYEDYDYSSPNEQISDNDR